MTTRESWVQAWGEPQERPSQREGGDHIPPPPATQGSHPCSPQAAERRAPKAQVGKPSNPLFPAADARLPLMREALERSLRELERLSHAKPLFRRTAEEPLSRPMPYRRQRQSKILRQAIAEPLIFGGIASEKPSCAEARAVCAGKKPWKISLGDCELAMIFSLIERAGAPHTTRHAAADRQL